MNLQVLLAAQVAAADQRRGELDAVRAAMEEGECHPECVDYVIGELRTILDRHSGTSIHDGSASAIAAAHAADETLSPLIADLKFALVVALVDAWNLRRAATRA